ncbi:MAG: thiamine-phosphate kinase [Propioniciclava sp.]
MSPRTAGEIGEFALIASFTEGLTPSAQVPVGPGDDAAVIRPHGDLVISTDAMVQDTHFRTSWSGPHDVGRKAVASAVADIEAMGARPVAIVVALSVPADVVEEWLAEFSRGVRAEADLAGVSLAGGDLTRGPVISAAVTALGDLDGAAPVLRSGARPGNVVAVTGRLGMAGAGLAVLGRGFRSPGAVVRAHRVPEVPYGQGVLAREAGATSLIDCSDGLLADLGHVAEASRVTIDLTAGAFEVDEAQKTVAAAIGGGDPLTFILTGGDDHALIGTFARAEDLPPGWRIIGRVTAAAAVPAVTVDGAAWEGDDTPGWHHF